MNHKTMTLAIVAIVAAVAVTAAAFAIPQQALAGGHNLNHGSSIEVSQNTSQINACTNNATCVNSANDSAEIHH